MFELILLICLADPMGKVSCQTTAKVVFVNKDLCERTGAANIEKALPLMKTKGHIKTLIAACNPVGEAPRKV